MAENNENGDIDTEETFVDQAVKPDFRLPSANKLQPRAVADGSGGTIIAVADISAPPERVFKALTTDEVERWWGAPGFYRQRDWQADLRVPGEWRVSVVWEDGNVVHADGEFCEISSPNKLVMTRRFDNHPLLGPRATTITYRIEPGEAGSRLTVRDEGFVGRTRAAYGNAEHWERVLDWLETYMTSDAH